MKQFIALLIIAGVIVGYYLQQLDQTADTGTKLKPALNDNKASKLPALTLFEPLLNVDEQQSSTFEVLFNSDDLVNAPLNQLKDSIILFWQQCRRENLCQQWLSTLELQLTKQRYQLLAQYPEDQQQLTLLLQHAQLDETLMNKVATVKAIYQQIWGEQAAILFNEEFAFYDSRVELSQLAEQIELYQQSEILDLLDASSNYDNKSVTITGEQEKYNQAVELLSAKLSIQEQAQLKIKLAERYFSAAEAKNIAIRQNQIIEQQQQVQSYQNQLLALKLELSQQRNSILSDLTEPEWQAHQSQALIEFRQAFFAP